MCCSKGSGLRRKKKSNDGRSCNSDRRYSYHRRIWDTSIKEATLDMLGTAATVKVDKENTVIVGGGGDAEGYSRHRIASLKTQIEDTTSEFDREKTLRKDLLNLQAVLQLSRLAQLQKLN